MSTTTFTLREEHLTLLSNLNFRESRNYHPVPEIDSKRPFGNSDPVQDVRDALDSDVSDSEATNLLSELSTALNVVTALQTFEPGTYKKDTYGNNWERIDNE